MSAAIAGAFALALALLLHKKKKLPKLTLFLVVGGVSSLLGGVAADTIRSWSGQVDSAFGDFTEGAVHARIPLLGLIGFFAFGWIIFEMTPKAKPKPNAVWLAAALPLLAPMIPGRVGDGTTKIVGGVNSATTGLMTGLFSNDPIGTPPQPASTRKPTPKPTRQPAAPVRTPPAG
jgi:hypothetical protein